MKLAFVISSLQNGGAERVLVNMANYWSRKGHSIEIFTLWTKGSKPFYELDDAVIHTPLSLARDSKNVIQFVANNLRRVRVIRSAIKTSRPDILCSFLDRTNVLVSLASIGVGIPLVLCEHTDPSKHTIGGRGWELLRTWTYPQADAVVVLTNEALAHFSPRIRSRTVVIPNGIVSTAETVDPSRRVCRHKIISAGRLSEEKGFDLLLQAFSMICVKFPQWSLTIWGEGPKRSTLEQLRERLGLADCVSLPGRTKNLFQEMSASDLFVSSSRFEGFPMVLLEAMANSLPVISFDCSSGSREIVRHDIDGVLVATEDVAALADAMSRLMSNAPLRNQLAQRAGEVVHRYSMEKVMGLWEELLGKILKSSVRRLSTASATKIH
jgi:GalNAc-alpha-(1->4)-GalNAc-alpha-(1->3)-diNAcBac-PP-undecaprenol alpha-1,4-N-acetyl-D-galactosaminyltransferase